MRKLICVAALLGGSLLPLMPAVAAPVVVPMPTGGVVTGPHHRYYHNGRYYNHRYYHRGHWYYR